MKQILSVFCCALYMHSISQAPLDMRISTQRSFGERVLIKALTAIVNREGRKRRPVKKPNAFSHEWF